MPKFRKKPVVIEARRWLGSVEVATELIDWVLENNGTASYHDFTDFPEAETYISINTLEGTMVLRAGNYLIRGVQGEFYSCDQDIFAATYEAVAE